MKRFYVEASVMQVLSIKSGPDGHLETVIWLNSAWNLPKIAPQSCRRFEKLCFIELTVVPSYGCKMRCSVYTYVDMWLHMMSSRILWIQIWQNIQSQGWQNDIFSFWKTLRIIIVLTSYTVMNFTWHDI